MRALLVVAACGGPVVSAAPQSARAWMGVAIEKGPSGVLVKDTFPGTPAATAGLQAGDEILKVNEQVVTSPPELIAYIGQQGVGFTVTVSFRRGGQEQKRQLDLVAKPDAQALLATTILNRPAKDFKIQDAYNQQTVAQDAIKTGTHIMMFWATWCPACKSTLPAVYQYARSKATPTAAVWLISAEDGKTLRDFFAAQPVPAGVRVFTDPDGAMNGAYGIPALPTFVVVKDGKVVHAEIGGGRYFANAVAATL